MRGPLGEAELPGISGPASRAETEHIVALHLAAGRADQPSQTPPPHKHTQDPSDLCGANFLLPLWGWGLSLRHSEGLTSLKPEVGRTGRWVLGRHPSARNSKSQKAMVEAWGTSPPGMLGAGRPWPKLEAQSGSYS